MEKKIGNAVQRVQTWNTPKSVYALNKKYAETLDLVLQWVRWRCSMPTAAAMLPARAHPWKLLFWRRCPWLNVPLSLLSSRQVSWQNSRARNLPRMRWEKDQPKPARSSSQGASRRSPPPTRRRLVLPLVKFPHQHQRVLFSSLAARTPSRRSSRHLCSRSRPSRCCCRRRRCSRRGSACRGR